MRKKAQKDLAGVAGVTEVTVRNGYETLKRLRKKRCTKALEYVMAVSCNGNPLDTFAREMCNTATEYLRELS